MKPSPFPRPVITDIFDTLPTSRILYPVFLEPETEYEEVECEIKVESSQLPMIVMPIESPQAP